jgi:bifunctional ADP-heptose synthase (sugar kinase/adenylyltransferase)
MLVVTGGAGFIGSNVVPALNDAGRAVLVKGGDYMRDTVVGHEIVEAHGGEVMLVNVLQDFSTTSLVNRARGGRA